MRERVLCLLALILMAGGSLVYVVLTVRPTWTDGQVLTPKTTSDVNNEFDQAFNEINGNLNNLNGTFQERSKERS